LFMLYFDLLLFFFIISPSFSPKNIYVKLFTLFLIIITVPDWVQMLTYQCLCLHCTRAPIDKQAKYQNIFNFCSICFIIPFCQHLTDS
jgi:hypothetical protein